MISPIASTVSSKLILLSDTAVSPNLGEGKLEEVCCYATPCLLDNGDLVAIYRTGSAKHSRDGKLVCVRSTDGGATWSQPSVVFDGLSNPQPESAHNGYIWRNADGGIDGLFQTVEATHPDLYVFSEDGRKLLRRFYRSSSGDGGKTWATPRMVVGESASAASAAITGTISPTACRSRSAP